MLQSTYSISKKRLLSKAKIQIHFNYVHATAFEFQIGEKLIQTLSYYLKCLDLFEHTHKQWSKKSRMTWIFLPSTWITDSALTTLRQFAEDDCTATTIVSRIRYSFSPFTVQRRRPLIYKGGTQDIVWNQVCIERFSCTNETCIHVLIITDLVQILAVTVTVRSIEYSWAAFSKTKITGGKMKVL